MKGSAYLLAGRIRRKHLHCSTFYKIALIPSLASGCSRAPSYEIVGSIFPAWLLCLVVALVLTFGARWLFLRTGIVLAVPVLTYPSLTALLTFALWLTFFR